MPQIAEMKEIDGALWVRVGVIGDFPSGIAIYTPDEVERLEKQAVLTYLDNQEQ